MPRIFDNIDNRLIEGLRQSLAGAIRADFCVGYFNLRGWASMADFVESFGTTEVSVCRVLVGMHRPPDEEMRLAQGAIKKDISLDAPTAARLKRKATEHFKEQLEFGIPTRDAEGTLRRLARQIRSGRVKVKLFLRYPLHAKLYLVYRSDAVAPLIGFLGSSNLTLAGLSEQGELNVDVVEQDAAVKLKKWFDDRWADRFALDISNELAELIETSWARDELVPPYLVYLKMAYHLSEDARIGEKQFKLPLDLRGVLLDFQVAAVQLAARLLYKHGGMLLGDVVGFGKTLMATTVARIFQEDDGSNTLIVCPPKLKELWQRYVDNYGLAARVMSLGAVLKDLRDLARFRTVIIDESHNLRNREGHRYKALKDYIEFNDSRVILVTATPYNKQFSDLSNQLRLFLDDDQDLGVRPELFFQAWTGNGYNEADFSARFQASPRSLKAFDQSPFSEDWRDLMRLFLVRRTRQFIIKNYATFDNVTKRPYVMLNNKPFFFPVRQPKTVTFVVDEDDQTDQFAKLFRDDVISVIENLLLPRYGLAKYLTSDADSKADSAQLQILQNLNRAGRRLIGFCKTNLFKRLESCGYSFLLSLRRHILRNMVALYALENDLDMPIGTQNAADLDLSVRDLDTDVLADDDALSDGTNGIATDVFSLQSFEDAAQRVYTYYREEIPGRFDWLGAKFFRAEMKADLRSDAENLLSVLTYAGTWKPESDSKLQQLFNLLTTVHKKQKVLVFSQFADTALYLGNQLKNANLSSLEIATGETADPVSIVRRFSPKSNNGLRQGEKDLRVLIATDVLAEGQNLQDCAIVVNYDLPWAIIRLIQRAGRVDRIGQENDTILIYSFLPAEGVDRIIRLRLRLVERLQQNQEVIGTDESFFGEEGKQKLVDLYTEKSGVLDDDSADEDVDLTSMALQVWNSASEDARKKAEKFPSVIYATRSHTYAPHSPGGVLIYVRFLKNAEKHDMLIRLDEHGNLVSQSLASIFKTAACPPETPALEPLPNHHELAGQAVRYGMKEIQTLGGQLGTLRSIRRKVYERLKTYKLNLQRHPSSESETTVQRIDTLVDILFRCPLKEGARDTLSRQLRVSIPDQELMEICFRLYDDGRLCDVVEEGPLSEPQILCSLGLKET